MSAPEDDTTIPARPRRSKRAPVFAPGTCLSGTYELLGVLGEGGMGQVFDAKDLVLDRRVAIKVGWPDRDPQSLRMEARAPRRCVTPAWSPSFTSVRTRAASTW